MQAVILAGGEGTRLRPLTDTVPKPLLPIANRPFLEHQIRWMGSHGVREAMLLTGYLADAFVPFAARAAGQLGVSLLVEHEDEPLGTAGAVRRVLDRLSGTTLVFNGDVLTDLDLGALLAFHRERRAGLTIALARVDDAGPYGLVPTDTDGRVLEFVEKPAPEVARRGGAVNAGTYVIEPRVLADVPSGRTWSFERQVFPSLGERGEVVCGFVADAYWIDIGTPERYRRAHRDALDGRVRLDVAGRLIAEGPGAPALLAEGVSVGRGARVGPHATLGPGAVVGPGTIVEDSVLFEEARVGEGAVVRRSVLGRSASVAAGARVEDAVIGDRGRA